VPPSVVTQIERASRSALRFNAWLTRFSTSDASRLGLGSGEVISTELDEIDALAAFLDLDGEIGGLIGPDDVSFVGEDLDPGSAAVVLLIEDLWAVPLARALGRSRAVLLEGTRIPQDLVDAAIAALPAS